MRPEALFIVEWAMTNGLYDHGTIIPNPGTGKKKMPYHEAPSDPASGFAHYELGLIRSTKT